MRAKVSFPRKATVILWRTASPMDEPSRGGLAEESEESR